MALVTVVSPLLVTIIWSINRWVKWDAGKLRPFHIETGMLLTIPVPNPTFFISSIVKQGRKSIHDLLDPHSW
jgi:hypothetical protein